MSRIGKKPIALPAGVKVSVLPDRIEFEGKKGKLRTPLHEGITAKAEGGTLTLDRRDDSKPQKALHGLCRALAANAVLGVSQGFQKQLEIVGVGYKAKLDKDKLELALGYSKPDDLHRPARRRDRRAKSRPCSPSGASTSSGWARWRTTSRRSASPTRTSRRASATSARS